LNDQKRKGVFAMGGRIPQSYLLRMVSIGNKIENVQIFVGIFCVVSFFTFVTLDVFARTILHPIISAQEIAIFSYIWAVFMGSGVAVRKDSHFKIDFLLNMLPDLKVVFSVINFVLAIVFVYLMIGPGLEFALMGIKRVSNPSGIPLIIPSIAIPIAGVFFLYFLVEGLLCTLAHWKVADIKEYLEDKSAGGAK
jgi:TRAP-type C4-dicarboxylate transport system permease small subunit